MTTIFSRLSRIVFVGSIMLTSITADVSAAKVKARLTDVSGQVYDMASVRLDGGGLLWWRNGRLAVVCGGARMEVGFKRVGSMKIDPGQIISVDGQPFFGVEIRLRDGSVIGDVMETGRCFVGANSISGRTVQKVPYNVSFGGLMSVQFFGKGEEAGARRGEDDDDEEDDED